MSLVQATGLRDLSLSPFPLQARRAAPHFAWHDCYPANTPAGLEYPPLRAEELLLCAGRQFAARTALQYYRTAWSYAELIDRVQQAAGNLLRLGIEPGDRVMLVLPNSPDFVVAWFALHWVGAEVVPANPLLSGKCLARLAEKTAARAVLGLDVRLGPVLELTRRYPMPLLIVTSLAPHLPLPLRLAYLIERRRQGAVKVPASTVVHSFEVLTRPYAAPVKEPLVTGADLPAVLQPTGGTTGTPKVAVLTHNNLHANVAQLHVWCGLKPGTEVVLSVLPFFHIFGSTVAMLSPIAGGATLLLQARFSTSQLWKLMRRWRPTVVPMVPFMFASLCEEMRRRRRNLTGMRICMSGAASLRADLNEEFYERTGVAIIEGYGLSEASPVTHANPPDGEVQPGSIGLPLPDTLARVVDPQSGLRELPPGEIGELVVRGPQVMSGYLDHPEDTATTLRNGWLYTGDLAYMDTRGYFTLVERKKDMIISGGLNIFPSEVEQVLAAHPLVEECAVVGAPDERYGERLVAYVVPRQGAQLNVALLQAHCRGELASYKVPRTIRVCEVLPHNFLGKVRRVELRQHEAQADERTILHPPHAPAGHRHTARSKKHA
jgi:long-chain acyl-CoA synthetase